MLDILQSKFNQLEKSRSELFNLLKDIDEDKLTQPPQKDKWSIIQIIFHLVKTERLFHISFVKSRKNINEINKTGIIENIKSSFLNLILNLPFKYKAPRILGNMPAVYDFNELKKKWISIRNQVKEELEKVKESELKGIIFKHPLAGNMNIIQSLNFLNEHFDRHFEQIKQLKKSL